MDNGVKKLKPIAETDSGIILAEYRSERQKESGYQTEAELERRFIGDLVNQGYERKNIHTSEELWANLKKQIERLNVFEFSASEWQRFCNEYLDVPSEGKLGKTRKLQTSHEHDLRCDDGNIRNICLIDKVNLNQNHMQVVSQVSQEGLHKNRYDVSILVNGLPLVHVELKKRGVALSQAFWQVQRYGNESLNTQHSLYQWVQLFVISNGTFTRYFANTTKREQNNYEFTCEWADAKNTPIHDLEDFCKTFFDKRTLLTLLTRFCVFNSQDVLMVMRPYQICAAERILNKIKMSDGCNAWGKVEGGGYIWHTTGSGKTLTSFKAARLATALPCVDKVLFVVDRKDLDYQTMIEYENFQKGSVSGTTSTRELRDVLEKNDQKIVVTTIQKLGKLVKENPKLPVYEQKCVLIFDECHRSQFGEAQRNIRKKFKKYCQFGFTGTPIFPDNAYHPDETTQRMFGQELHCYNIIHAIRDGKVLKFKVDYNTVNPKFKDAEQGLDEKSEQKLKAYEQALKHPERIVEVVAHILKVYGAKTRRTEQYHHKEKTLKGFNALFAVQSIEMAKLYYDAFKEKQATLPDEKRLKVGAIFSFAPNEEQHAVGDIEEESMETTALNSTGKAFLNKVMTDYNNEFKTNFNTEGNSFEHYYKDLAKRVKEKEIDLLIVVGMFLTGFDAPTLNTLFVDKNLKYHGLLQAFSRTNRILNAVKKMGNIVCFRDLKQEMNNALKLFGKNSDYALSVIEARSFDDYMNGYVEENGKKVRGYKEVCLDIKEEFPDPVNLKTDEQKKAFVAAFGEVLKKDNILRNFDEFIEFLENEPIITPRDMQDMKSAYMSIREEFFERQASGEQDENSISFDDITFEVELLESLDVEIEYIFNLMYEEYKKHCNKDVLKQKVYDLVRSSLSLRGKEGILMAFVDSQDFDELNCMADVWEAFNAFARKGKDEQIKQLIEDERLKNDTLQAEHFIQKCIEHGFVQLAGEDFGNILPPMSMFGKDNKREETKQRIIRKIEKLIQMYGGAGMC